MQHVGRHTDPAGKALVLYSRPRLNTNCDRKCPICGRENSCLIANGSLYRGQCWCETISVSERVLRYLAQERYEHACLCRRCFSALARHANNVGDPEQVLALTSAESAAASPDFYLDEYGRTVFTADYHLKRGYCCSSGCRHCPYEKDQSLPASE
jgi:hypothetical protein